MWIPVLISLSILGLFKLALFSSPQTSSDKTKTIASGTQSRERSYANQLIGLLKNRETIPEWLVSEAMREAFEAGDWSLVRSLSRAFDQTGTGKLPNEKPESPPSQPLTVVGKNSPIYGVTNDDWSAFVDKLETKQVDYRDDKHVGAYYHHKNRLTEIGINAESLTDKQAQYNALESDLKDVLARYKKLINDWSGDVIKLNNQTLSVTRSGILGLIKAAGADGALGWLKHDQQRLQYPMTTEMFLRTNGLF